MAKEGWLMDMPDLSDASLLRLVLLFALTFFALHWGYQEARGMAIERAIIDTATVKPSVFFINRIRPDEQARAQGHRLVSPYVKLSVLNGCEGTESLFLIIAAIMAFRSSWRHKAVGLCLGMPLIYLANQVRIVSLYFALRYDRMWFEILHGYIGPTFIIALGCVFYLWWMKWSVSQCYARESI